MRQALKFMAALVVCAVVLTPAASSLGATSANAPMTLLANFRVSSERPVRGMPGFSLLLANAVPLVHPDIAAVTVTLYLPKGATIGKSRFRVCCDLGNAAGDAAKTRAQRWTLVRTRDGVLRPRWVYRHLRYVPAARWYFWLKLPLSLQGKTYCVSALGKPTGGPTQPAGKSCQRA